MSIKKSLLLIVTILLIDQISKIYIKTHFVIGEETQVFDWFEILFVENKGMAWGAQLSDFFSFMSDRSAKVSLTLFRIFAIFGIGYWLLDVIKNQASKILILALSYIFSGALGNIIDSVFYGVLFSSSNKQVATFLPNNGGYDTVLHGRVVDMLHFPIWKGFIPNWVPFIGGEFFTFFEPVFNVADIAISVGFGLLIFFNKQAFPKNKLNITAEI